jgi:predicted nicotinamide N-methyase
MGEPSRHRDDDRDAFIAAHTEVVAPKLVPEIALHLATELTTLWTVTEAWLAEHALPPPYWAFAWAGGQALARHVLDHPELVRGRAVVDFGSGSGLVAIAAAMAGARRVIAADIDAVALRAIVANARRAGVHVEATIETTSRDLIDDACADLDVVLAGDICYEQPMSTRVLPWLAALARAGKTVLVGEPGRAYAPTAGVEEIARYDVETVADVEGVARKIGRVLRVVSLGG